MKLRFWFLVWRVKIWISRHMPEWCSACGWLDFRHKLLHVRHVTGRWVALCPDCYEKVYRPLGSEDGRK